MKKQQSSQKQMPVFNKTKDEKILVVSTKKLFCFEAFHGIKKVDFESYQKTIDTHKKFLWRSDMETNENYKQIIPYLIFNYQDKYFLMQRKNNSSEVRLQNKCSLGIGGHIRKEDLQKTSILGWAEREFHEEVSYNGSLKIEPIGVLNDDSDEVGRVHLGLVFLLRGDSKSITIKDEHHSGTLLTLQECKQFYNQMEQWSRMVFKHLNT
jgi:predicted NUDIX family phosphoesterase